jgi:hypothetical protein
VFVSVRFVSFPCPVNAFIVRRCTFKLAGGKFRTCLKLVTWNGRTPPSKFVQIYSVVMLGLHWVRLVRFKKSWTSTIFLAFLTFFYALSTFCYDSKKSKKILKIWLNRINQIFSVFLKKIVIFFQPCLFMLINNKMYNKLFFALNIRSAQSTGLYSWPRSLTFILVGKLFNSLFIYYSKFVLYSPVMTQIHLVSWSTASAVLKL